MKVGDLVQTIKVPMEDSIKTDQSKMLILAEKIDLAKIKADEFLKSMSM